MEILAAHIKLCPPSHRAGGTHHNRELGLEMVSYYMISIFPVILCTFPSFAQCFLKLNCESSVTGIFSKDTKLPCTFNSASNMTLTHIELVKMEEDRIVEVFTSKKSVNGIQGRIKLLHPESQDVSLVIQNTQLSDIGTYQYHLESSVGHDTGVIILQVKAPYNVTIFPNIISTRRVNVTCEAIGYPLAQIHWLLNGTKNLTSKVNTRSVKSAEELYKITSTLQITEKIDIPECVYICAVWSMEEGQYVVQKHLPFFHQSSNRDGNIEEKDKNVLIAAFLIITLIYGALVISALPQFRRSSHPEIRREFEIPMVSSDHRINV
ncbi:programmed cell death 1 ligand 1-like isoform X2 [Chiloscyllium plagiosum]|uniref:programmed cell death 1 ligand 1-like isoform X2 n=1 Tax=Chiloscyllium plagiosum TaxID=36176 RepID=UPI001CB86BA4|nr:programmed cell death 1 ligand 1-like isoform X2 [Chiloscyllium plagiosum]